MTETASSKNRQIRNACFTLNNPTVEAPAFAQAVCDALSPSYLVFQLERGEQGTPHFQGYIEFKGPKSFKHVQRTLLSAHLESRRGSAAQAAAYCKKPDSRVDGPWEFGEISSQGRRTDLSDAVAALREGGMPLVLQRHPESYVKFGNGLRNLSVQLHKYDRRDPPEVTLLFGPPGVGKTHFAFDGEPLLVSIPGSLQWFDNYADEEAVLFDDFDGRRSSAPLKQLLNLLDRYPLMVPVKGSHVNFVARRIYITTNFHPRDWYDWSEREQQYAALKRRFSRVLWWKSAERDSVVTLIPSDDGWVRFWAGRVDPVPRELGPMDDYVIHPDPVDYFNF